MKTIGLSEDAYEVLKHLKRPGESFSDVVLRMSGLQWLERFVGTMDDETARHYHDVMDEGRRRADEERGDRLQGWTH